MRPGDVVEHVVFGWRGTVVSGPGNGSLLRVRYVGDHETGGCTLATAEWMLRLAPEQRVDPGPTWGVPAPGDKR